jgi:hypothetical protein
MALGSTHYLMVAIVFLTSYSMAVGPGKDDSSPLSSIQSLWMSGDIQPLSLHTHMPCTCTILPFLISDFHCVLNVIRRSPRQGVPKCWPLNSTYRRTTQKKTTITCTKLICYMVFWPITLSIVGNDKQNASRSQWNHMSIKSLCHPPPRGWPKCNRLPSLGCQYCAVILSWWYECWYVWACSTRTGLKPKFYKLPRPWSPWRSSPARENSHGRTRNWTRDLMVSSQKLWPPSHEAGQLFWMTFRYGNMARG